MWGPFLLKGEQGFYVAFVNFGDETEVGEVTFLLFGLLGQNVAFEGVFSFDFSRAGKDEPFFGTGVCFNLGHCCVVCIKRVN